jgi:hypothetical protein
MRSNAVPMTKSNCHDMATGERNRVLPDGLLGNTPARSN